MKSRPALASIVAAAVVAGGALIYSFQALPTADPDDPLFAARFKDFNRTFQPLEQWRGKPLVVYFWATWCEPCKREVPELIKVYEENKARGLEVVGIAVDNADKVQAFAKEYRITYHVLLGGNDALSLSRKMGNAIGGLPFLVAVDRKGRIIGTHIGELPPGKLEELVAPLVS